MQTMDIFVLWQKVIAEVNTQQGGPMKPNLNFILWVNTISKQLFTEKVKEFQKSRRITDELLPFLMHFNAATTPAPNANYDVITLPADYAYFSSLRVFFREEDGCACADPEANYLKDGKCLSYQDPDLVELQNMYKGTFSKEVNVGDIDNQRWGAALNHKLMSPDMNNPKCTTIDGLLKIAPRSIGLVILDYFRYPKEAVFAFTTNSDDTINYNLNGSTQLDWPLMVIENEFIPRLKKKFSSYTGQDQKYKEAEVERQISQ